MAKLKTQRVWVYDDDYKTFGITDDCKKCIHNHRWGYNVSRMIHSEKYRNRMEAALATTEDGQRRLAVAEERMNQKLAKEVEEADARPERGIVAEAGPDVGFEDPQQRSDELAWGQLDVCLLRRSDMAHAQGSLRVRAG